MFLRGHDAGPTIYLLERMWREAPRPAYLPFITCVTRTLRPPAGPVAELGYAPSASVDSGA